jgi:hypothetical protein
MFFIDNELEEKGYWTEDEAMEALMKLHPELGNDALIDYFESHVSEDAPYFPEVIPEECG